MAGKQANAWAGREGAFSAATCCLVSQGNSAIPYQLKEKGVV